MTILQSGPRSTNIVLVGEAPLTAGDLVGKLPFTGGYGEILKHTLSRAGITYDECFSTHVIHAKPPFKGLETFIKGEGQSAFIQGVLQLKADIEAIKPNLVLGLGKLSLQTLTGKTDLEKWRGSILGSTLVKGQKVICSYPPDYMMAVPETRAIANADFQKAFRQSAFPELRLPQREFFLNPDAATRARIRDEMLAAPELSVDIECWLNEKTGKWYLVCISFSDSPHRSMVIHVLNDPAAFLDAKILCEAPMPKITQNGMFDFDFLRQSGINIQNFGYDTMLGHHCLMPECASGEDEMAKLSGKKRMSVLKKGLAFQVAWYTDEPFYKDDGKAGMAQQGDLRDFWIYNGKDSAVTFEIANVQRAETIELLEKKDIDIRPSVAREMRAAEALMSATNIGIKIDTEMRDSLKAMYLKEIDRLQDFMDTAAGEKVNVKSAPGIRKLLYETLGLPEKHHHKTGNVTANKDAIVELAGKYQHPILLTILKIRERRDYLEKYINVQLSDDGRIRCSFDLTGTTSGRLSSRAYWDGSGTNLQNIPARKKIGELVKRMFIADEGKLFVYRDFSQAEARIVAYLARCNGLIELFEDPTRDIHKENAARIFNKPVEDVTDEERYLAKRVVHACNYGMGGTRLVQIVNEDAEVTGIRINQTKADELVAKYFWIYPELRSVFWRGVEKELSYNRRLSTPLGRSRQFFGRMDDATKRIAYSYIPQSVVGDMGIEASIGCYEDIQKRIPEIGAQFLVNVHDSVLMQVDEAHWQRCEAEMQAVMDIPITIYGNTFKIPTDCKIGRNWAKKTEDNPAGLRDTSKGTEGLGL